VLIYVVSPGNRRQTSNVSANPGITHSAHGSRRSAAGQTISCRQQVSHSMRQPVTSSQPQVALMYIHLFFVRTCHFLFLF